MDNFADINNYKEIYDEVKISNNFKKIDVDINQFYALNEYIGVLWRTYGYNIMQLYSDIFSQKDILFEYINNLYYESELFQVKNNIEYSLYLEGRLLFEGEIFKEKIIKIDIPIKNMINRKLRIAGNDTENKIIEMQEKYTNDDIGSKILKEINKNENINKENYKNLNNMLENIRKDFAENTNIVKQHLKSIYGNESPDFYTKLSGEEKKLWDEIQLRIYELHPPVGKQNNEKHVLLIQQICLFINRILNGRLGECNSTEELKFTYPNGFISNIKNEESYKFKEYSKNYGQIYNNSRHKKKGDKKIGITFFKMTHFIQDSLDIISILCKY